MSTLPTDADARKNIPLARGLLDYFPDALCDVAELSRIGNEQHNPGEPLQWAKEKSTDEADALLRHLVDRGTIDSDGVRHSTKVAWRALALLQREIEAERERPSKWKCPEVDCTIEPYHNHTWFGPLGGSGPAPMRQPYNPSAAAINPETGRPYFDGFRVDTGSGMRSGAAQPGHPDYLGPSMDKSAACDRERGR